MLGGGHCYYVFQGKADTGSPGLCTQEAIMAAKNKEIVEVSAGRGSQVFLLIQLFLIASPLSLSLSDSCSLSLSGASIA